MDIYCSSSMSCYVVLLGDIIILFLFVIYWNEPSEHGSSFMFDFDKRTVLLVKGCLYSYLIV